ncbi:hypothetical protein [Myxococcus sp. Y35]|uniref:hypothetical protein n=1 Tax=Pseudomyxococcus flavus TaxID=3115648 RepID=UPI003CF00BF3
MKALKELAGHPNLSTTWCCMHLSPAAGSVAIRMLEGAKPEAQNLSPRVSPRQSHLFP